MKYYVKMKSGEIKVEHLITKSLVPIDVQASMFRESVKGHATPFGDYIIDEWYEETA